MGIYTRNTLTGSTAVGRKIADLIMLDVSASGPRSRNASYQWVAEQMPPYADDFGATDFDVLKREHFDSVLDILTWLNVVERYDMEFGYFQTVYTTTYASWTSSEITSVTRDYDTNTEIMSGEAFTHAFRM